MRGRNMFAREITRDAVTSHEVVVIWDGLIANGWLIFIKLIKPNSGQRKWNLSTYAKTEHYLPLYMAI